MDTASEFLGSALAGALSFQGWAVRARDAFNPQTEKDDVYITIVNESKMGRERQGSVRMSFRLSDLTQDNISGERDGFMRAFDDDISPDYVAKSLIMDGTNRISIVQDNEHVMFAAQIDADQGFIQSASLKEISDFAREAEKEIDTLYSSVLQPYIDDELSDSFRLNCIGIAEPGQYNDKNYQSAAPYEVFDIGDSYVKAAKVVDGTHMPAEFFVVETNDNGEKIIDFEGWTMPLSAIKQWDSENHDKTVDQALNDFEDYMSDKSPEKDSNIHQKSKEKTSLKHRVPKLEDDASKVPHKTNVDKLINHNGPNI